MTATPLEPDPVHDPDPADRPVNPWGDPTAPPSPAGPPAPQDDPPTDTVMPPRPGSDEPLTTPLDPDLPEQDDPRRVAERPDPSLHGTWSGGGSLRNAQAS